MKDFYCILGVDVNCTVEEVKEAYYKLSKKFHPDLNQNDSYFESRFKEIHEAYETLSDPEKRRLYNFYFNNAKTQSPDFEFPEQRRYPRTTAIDIIFTIILIGITILFGKYVVASMTEHSKKVRLSETPIIADTPRATFVPAKHRKKKKHNLFPVSNYSQKSVAAKAAINPVASSATTIAKVPGIVSNLPAKVKTDTLKPQPVVMVNHPAQPFKTISNTGDNNIPYTTYLRSNITGVVNMRRSDNLNSAIVAVIPTHSKVLVLQKGDNYYKVQYNDNEGYVPSWTVLTK